jgi:hypothetical protein
MRRSLLCLPTLMLSITAAASAQAPAATPITIDSGMTRAQVIARLGEPMAAKSYGSSTFLSYANGCARTCGMQDLVILQGDRVVDAIFRAPNHAYSGRSSSPRMIPANEARKAGVAKGVQIDTVAKAKPPGGAV